MSDAPTLASGDNEGMDVRRPAAAGVLGLLSVAELAARLVAGSTVRAGLAAAPVTHIGVSAPTALLMCALCLLATLPATLLRPVPAAVAVCVAAVSSLGLFELVTAAGSAALLLVAYRLARNGSRLLAVALVLPFLAAALAAAASGMAGAAPAPGLTGADVETRMLAVLLASAIPVAALAGMAVRAREESRAHSAVRELTEGVSPRSVTPRGPG